MTNEAFGRFVESTGYQTENEVFGWSFVFDKLLPQEVLDTISQAVAGAGEHALPPGFFPFYLSCRCLSKDQWRLMNLFLMFVASCPLPSRMVGATGERDMAASRGPGLRCSSYPRTSPGRAGDLERRQGLLCLGGGQVEGGGRWRWDDGGETASYRGGMGICGRGREKRKGRRPGTFPLGKYATARRGSSNEYLAGRLPALEYGR